MFTVDFEAGSLGELLGAFGLGDIGEWFPDNDPQYDGLDSSHFVTRALAMVREKGWEPGNVDVIIFAQRPKLSPWKEAIRDRVAELLEIDPGQVNVKAKTGEKVGPIGREEAISAEVVILLGQV